MTARDLQKKLADASGSGHRTPASLAGVSALRTPTRAPHLTAHTTHPCACRAEKRAAAQTRARAEHTTQKGTALSSG